MPDSRYTRTGKSFTALVLETFRLNGALLAAGDRLTAPLGLSSARWQVLGAIEEGPLSVAQIARNMGVSRQGVQRIADTLEKEGIIAYAPNPHHERAKLVRLSEKGIEIVKELTKRQIRWANEIATEASSDQIDAALHTMRCLRKRLESSRRS